MELNGVFTVNTNLNASALYSPASVLNAGGFTNRPQPSAATLQSPGWPSAVNNGTLGPAGAYPAQLIVNPLPAICYQEGWLDDEFREFYMESTVEQDIAWQIASNRKARKLSQKDLAIKCSTRQSAIARLEDPTYGKHSIAMLVKVAHAFECALRIKLIPYSQLAEEVQDTSDEALLAAPFSEEKHLIMKLESDHE